MASRLPPLESLRIFEAAARHANFSGAGRELALTPAAVSLRIRGLEQDLGDRADLRWVGTEEGHVGSTNWSLLNATGDVPWRSSADFA